MTKDSRGVGSVDLAAALLNVLAQSMEPMKLKDLASQAGFVPAQAHPYLVSLAKLGLVEKDPDSSRYALGPFALTLALAKLRRFDPIAAAAPRAAALSEKTNFSVVLTVWGACGPTVVQLHEGEGQVHLDTRPGTLYSVTGTATGRVFSHFLAPDVVEVVIGRQRAEGLRDVVVGPVVDLQSITQQRQFIHSHGFAGIDSAPVAGISAIAVPVFELGGRLSLVMTLIGTAGLVDIQPDSEHVRNMLDAAAETSAQLGHWKARPLSS